MFSHSWTHPFLFYLRSVSVHSETHRYQHQPVVFTVPFAFTIHLYKSINDCGLRSASVKVNFFSYNHSDCFLVVSAKNRVFNPPSQHTPKKIFTLSLWNIFNNIES